jgi:hypothetical protein
MWAVAPKEKKMFRQQQIKTLIQIFVNIYLIQKIKEHDNPTWLFLSSGKDSKITIDFCNGCKTDRSINSVLYPYCTVFACKQLQVSAVQAQSEERNREKGRKKNNNDFISSHFYSKGGRTCRVSLDLNLISNDHQSFFTPPLAK